MTSLIQRAESLAGPAGVRTGVLFTVTEKAADDPESNRTWTGVSAAGIRAQWPLFAALFPDGCENSLTFTAELNQWRIRPEYA